MDAVRVLVVDDERNARSALCELLREEGYQVDAVGDGIEALERVATFRPQVVLTDIRMPRMDGFELRDRLAALGPIPVIVLMSAHHELVAGGFFMKKPLRLDELYQTIATASARAHAG
jgi:CheY-like chemotaxis protein